MNELEKLNRIRNYRNRRYLLEPCDENLKDGVLWGCPQCYSTFHSYPNDIDDFVEDKSQIKLYTLCLACQRKNKNNPNLDILAILACFILMGILFLAMN